MPQYNSSHEKELETVSISKVLNSHPWIKFATLVAMFSNYILDIIMFH